MACNAPFGFNWIIDNSIALGNIQAGTYFPQLKDKNIDVVVIALPFLPRPKMDYVRNGISFLHIPSLDTPSQDLSKYFDLVYDFIDAYHKAGRKVLVHCHAGISRSSTLLASYLMRKYKLRANEAVQLLKSKRGIVDPNPGFLKQLRAHEQSLNREKFVIFEVPIGEN